MNHMKKTFKFLSSVLFVSILAVTNCHYSTGGSQTNGAVVANYVNSLVRSAVTGNCAISVNLGSLYAGAIVQGAAGSATKFPQAKYEAVTGSTISAQNYASYAAVPYNKKYDAFLTNSTDGTSWTNALRGTAIANQKASIDLGAYLGRAAFLCNANAATTGATLAAALTAYRTASTTAGADNFTAAENTAVTTLLTALGTNFATIEGAFTGFGCAAITGALAATYTNFGGSAQTVSLYNARLAYTSGLALMACARIPRSSCSTSALVTTTRDADVASLVATYQTINATPECRKPSTGLLASVLSTGATGLPKETTFLGANTTIDLGGGRIYQNTAAVGGSEGSLTGLSSTGLLAARAYPKSGALLGIASSFTSAHPMIAGTTAYPTATDGSVATPYYGGSNINATTVTSCDALGFGNYGPTPIQTTDSLATVNSKKTLTDVKEIVYAFSANNTVAKAYETAIASVSPTTATNDAIACNRQMRKTTTISSALGVGTTLPDINAGSGDGGATSLVSACVYGSNVTNRTVAAAVFSSLLPGLTSCPQAAVSGASSFGVTGLTTFSAASFPDGQ